MEKGIVCLSRRKEMRTGEEKTSRRGRDTPEKMLSRVSQHCVSDGGSEEITNTEVGETRRVGR